jgi:hypothetical protein
MAFRIVMKVKAYLFHVRIVFNIFERCLSKARICNSNREFHFISFRVYMGVLTY